MVDGNGNRKVDKHVIKGLLHILKFPIHPMDFPKKIEKLLPLFSTPKGKSVLFEISVNFSWFFIQLISSGTKKEAEEFALTNKKTLNRKIPN